MGLWETLAGAGAFWEALTHTDRGQRPRACGGLIGPSPTQPDSSWDCGGGGLQSPRAQSRLCGSARGQPR